MTGQAEPGMTESKNNRHSRVGGNLVYLALGVLLSSFLRALNGLRLSSKASSSLGLIVREPCICLRARISWGVCQAATR